MIVPEMLFRNMLQSAHSYTDTTHATILTKTNVIITAAAAYSAAASAPGNCRRGQSPPADDNDDKG